MIDVLLYDKAEKILQAARARNLHITTVESCTGGLIAATLTEIAGSSDVLECGFVTYSNRAKTMLVGVPASLIEAHGAVSRQVAIAMAEGGLQQARTEIAVAVTGIAGPDGGTPTKPVGLVHLAVACSRWKQAKHYEARFGALGRDEIRQATVAKAFDMLLDCIQDF